VRIMLDFMCSKEHISEQLVKAGTDWVICSTCGETAGRLVSAPRIALDGISGDFPTASAKWEQRRESHMKRERKNQERHGTYK
jgi:hypothetical protein